MPSWIDNKELLLARHDGERAVSGQSKGKCSDHPEYGIRFKPPDQKDEAQELLRREQTRAAPTIGA
jgi:hypothetical protein